MADGAAITYGFIGLGHQGTPMAERMISQGLRPWLWARRQEVLDRYADADATIAESPAALGAACDVIGLCLFDADATDAVLFGPGELMRDIRPGTVLAVHSTVDADYVVALAERVADRGVHVVDAPVSGGPKAATGELLVIAAGDEAARQRCAPMFDTYAKLVVHAGDLGASQRAKLVNNCLMTAITGLVFDAFEFGAELGIGADALAEVLANGSSSNAVLPIYRMTSAEDLSIRAYPTLSKDVAIARDVAAAAGLAEGALLRTAAATIADMEDRRAGWVAAQAAGGPS